MRGHCCWPSFNTRRLRNLPKQHRRSPWPEGKRAAISLSFDDARPSQIDNGLAVFARHGARATFYVNPGNMKQRFEGWKAAVAAGHELGNHSTNHPCTGNFPWSRSHALEDYTVEKMREELVETNREVQRLLGVAPATFGYPCGQKFVGRGRQAQSYVPLIAEMFVAGRGWLDENANDPAFCDLAQVMGVPIDNVSKLKFFYRPISTFLKKTFLLMKECPAGCTVTKKAAIQ